MHFSLGSYSHKRAQPSCRQLSAADGELDELLLQQPSFIHSISCTRAVQLTSTDLKKTVAPKPVALHHLGSNISILGRPPCFPDPFFSQKNWQGFTPAHPACKQLHGRSMRLWHSILQNHRKERLISKSNFRHPKCCWLGSKTLITCSFSVTVSLENLDFICMGHLERLSTLKAVYFDMGSHLTQESSPSYGICVGHATEGVKVSLLERAPPWDVHLCWLAGWYLCPYLALHHNPSLQQ